MFKANIKITQGMIMGNTIIRASHVGRVYHHVRARYGTPTEEELEIARRAAVHTRNRWAEERRNQKKKRSEVEG